MKKSVRLPAFAKINLCLHVLGRRPDGYHELRTIFQTISLHDTLESRSARLQKLRSITLETNDPALPTGPENLACIARSMPSAMRSGFAAAIHVRLEKRIPVARGLGGGSSDAAAALIGMLRLAEKKLPLERLMEIAAGLGADVPFFLFGGRAVAVNRGDEIYPLPDAPKRAVLVVSPKGIGVSTKEAYQWVSQELTNRPKPHNIWGFCALCWSRQGRSRTISRVPFSAVIRDLEKSGPDCSSEEPQMPRWRVAGRRCLEYSETQRRRAEPLVRSRKIRFSSWKPFPGKNMAAL